MNKAFPPIRLLVFLLYLVGTCLMGQVAPVVTALRSYSGGLIAPSRIATDVGGRIYITDATAGQILVRDELGRNLPGKAGLKGPLGIAVDASGRIYVAEEGSGSVSIFLSDWSLVGKLGQGDGEFNLPNHVAIAPSGLIYVSDSRANLIKVFSQDGTRLLQFGAPGTLSGQFDFPVGIYVSGAGEVFVGDQNNGRIQVFTTAGIWLRSFGSSSGMLGNTSVFGRLQGLTGDAAGRIFVADTALGVVKVLTSTGRALSNIGKFGEGFGQLEGPASVVIDRNNRLIVASVANTRVDLFGLDTFTDPHAVLDPPNTLSYATNPATYLLGQAISPNLPSNVGGDVAAYAVVPALPAGLAMDRKSGLITGTPLVKTPTGTYKVTASNAMGSTATNVVIAIKDLPPSNLAYSANPAAYISGSAITPNLPTHGGGEVSSFVISPELPQGLSLDPDTGVISGTPSAITPTSLYTVQAGNADGNCTAQLSITISGPPPTSLSYVTNPAVYLRTTSISPNVPIHGGGPVASYTVSPALPAGLSLDTLTGIISGTPTVSTAAAIYTVTASNAYGSTSVDLSITVQSLTPTALTYSTNPAIYARGVSITPNVPTHGGGPVSSYTVSPALPLGLSLNTSTGVITGTPSVLKATAIYTITAANADGSTSVALSITVTDLAPANLVYPTNPAVYIRGASISPNTPTHGGGLVTSYTVSPALPLGLYLSSSTGAITGTPTTLKAAAIYTVTASNSQGSTTVGLSITVKDLLPTDLVYPTNPAVYFRGSGITPNTPTHGGGMVSSYTISPALPIGMYLSSTTGSVTGTPTALKAITLYTVTATNSEGSTTVGLSITIIDLIPSNLFYPTNPAVYTKGIAITANTPTHSGGLVSAYTVSPALPLGLTLNANTGTISGTPSAILPTSVYTITATNSAGSTSVDLSITVNGSAL